MTHRAILLIPVLFSFLLGGCPSFGGSDSGDGGATHREQSVSGKLAIAVGGVAPGADEVTITEDLTTLDFENNDPDLFTLQPREGYRDYLAGKGARVVAAGTDGAIGYVTPIVNGRPHDPIEVTIPPQRLIQILIGESRGQLVREATTETGDATLVKLTSVSVTGDALGAVIRNRIDLINEQNSPPLFRASSEDYARNPPVSFYDAVIEAASGSVYQFSPVNPDDPSNEVYVLADRRSDLTEMEQVAYDQAVLTAAGIFSGDTEDATGGAFAFYSPTSAQYEALKRGLASRDTGLPSGCGASDANFPAFAPVQVLILTEVATSVTGGDVPSFVFVRPKQKVEPAVVSQ